jgi:hypothetical protein
MGHRVLFLHLHISFPLFSETFHLALEDEGKTRGIHDFYLEMM